jgi:hypothetical protein
MRGSLFIGLAVVLLIIGILVIKNMGADDPSGVQKTQTKAYLEKANNAAEDVKKRLQGIKKQSQAVD